MGSLLEREPVGVEVHVLVEPPPEALQIPLGLGQTDECLPVRFRLKPEGQERLVHSGDRILDHEHGPADLPERPFLGSFLGIYGRGHLHG